ncbi:hypothetical protein EHW66_21245 [Erwinia psidii]|uniref:hypothetical protein n=1 Tax=Erwinia psidii TaxID=69224 RepID=UPI00226B6B7D|nr:hypothetical protein [Erwinia psidii]MCX8967396.1 hypothetical protein [Erwinia psidii]
MAIDLNELNEAYTLSKCVKEIISKMTEYQLTENDDIAAICYGLTHICKSIVSNQEAAIEKLIKMNPTTHGGNNGN